MTDRARTAAGTHRAADAVTTAITARLARPAWAAARGRRGIPPDACRESDPRTDALTVLLARLRAAAACYAGGLRDEGACPEQMVVRVQALVAGALAAEGWSDLEIGQALTAHVVRWSVAAYDGDADDR